MKLEEALRLKKVKIREPAGFDLIFRENGQKIRKYKISERDATVEDVLAYNEEEGVIVTKDGQKFKLYK